MLGPCSVNNVSSVQEVLFRRRYRTEGWTKWWKYRRMKRWKKIKPSSPPFQIHQQDRWRTYKITLQHLIPSHWKSIPFIYTAKLNNSPIRILMMSVWYQIYILHLIKSGKFTIFTLNIGTPYFLYHTCPIICTSLFHYLLLCLKYCCTNCKQCRPWSDAAMRRLIWVYTVCSGLSVPTLVITTDKCLCTKWSCCE